MTETNCDLFTHNQSRSYLNHLVLRERKTSGNLRAEEAADLKCVLDTRVVRVQTGFGGLSGGFSGGFCEHGCEPSAPIGGREFIYNVHFTN
jgi:hypothetical protein